MNKDKSQINKNKTAINSCFVLSNNLNIKLNN